MPTCPRHHPLAAARPLEPPVRPIPERDDHRLDPAAALPASDPGPGRSVARRLAADDGSVATEYGLLAVVAATIVSVLLEWATGGGITALLSSILARVSELVGL